MFNKLNSISILVILTIVLDICVSENVELKIKQGIVSGLEEKTILKEKSYFSFRGIPYAKSPTGELRFMPPVIHEGWKGTLEAHIDTPTCMQFSSRMRMGERFGVSGSEDCLHLSIFTPSIKDSLPVLVFDYNDNLRTGFNGTNTYSPDFFIDEDVIVVFISHRLGLFGYLSTGDEIVPGNNGIRDVIVGLQWVQENIRDFGGDPNRVTLMGSRGGAVMIDILLRSEKAKGLFNAVIMQSGSSLETVIFPNNSREKAFKLGEVFHIITEDSSQLIKKLQNIEAYEIMAKEHHVLDGRRQEERFQLNVFPFSPVIEAEHSNAILTKLPEDLKIVNDVPILIGFNTREGLDLASPYIAEPKFVQEMGSQLTFFFPIRTNYRFDTNSTTFEEALSEIKKFYLTIGYFDVSNVLEYSIYLADVLQTYAQVTNIRTLVKEVASPIFYYVFDFRGALNENSEYIQRRTRLALGKRGATICDELCYLFVCSRIANNYVEIQKLVSEQPEMKVLKKTVRMWTNFVKTRNPTPEIDDVLQNIKWDPIDAASGSLQYLHINRKMLMKSDPFQERIKFWDDFLAKYGNMAVDGLVTKEEQIHEEL